jgi:hypothetical protein
MHITIRRYSINSGATRELVDQIQNGFVPIISKAPKFVAYYAIDEGDGDVSAISIFEDEASAEASNHMAATWVLKNLGHLISVPPKIIAGDVIVSHVP